MSGNALSGGAADQIPLKGLIGGSAQDNLGPVAGNFTVPKSGTYLVAAWGGGASTGGWGAALAIRTAIKLKEGDVIPYTVAACGGVGAGNDTTVTFPDGVMTAGGGKAASSTATGGDINVSGSPGNGSTLGGNAASYLGFTGGSGGSYGTFPGGGGGNGGFSQPAAGLIEFILVK